MAAARVAYGFVPSIRGLICLWYWYAASHPIAKVVHKCVRLTAVDDVSAILGYAFVFGIYQHLG